MGFTKAELAAYQDTLVDDLLPADCRLLFAGINPGLWSAATGAHFARPGNRFYPALYRAGITDHVIDARDGMDEADRALLVKLGIGITNVVSRATSVAAVLTREELRDGGEQLRERIRRVAPRVLAVAGITAYRSAFGVPSAKVGRQPVDWDGVEVWVVPNPSGLNAHESVDSLARAYRQVAIAAGVITESWPPPQSMTP